MTAFTMRGRVLRSTRDLLVNAVNQEARYACEDRDPRRSELVAFTMHHTGFTADRGDGPFDSATLGANVLFHD